MDAWMRLVRARGREEREEGRRRSQSAEAERMRAEGRLWLMILEVVEFSTRHFRFLARKEGK